MTKTFCDLCGDQITTSLGRRGGVTVADGAGALQHLYVVVTVRGTRKDDLCDKCVLMAARAFVVQRYTPEAALANFP
jgi:hypothetical protein